MTSLASYMKGSILYIFSTSLSPHLTRYSGDLFITIILLIYVYRASTHPFLQVFCLCSIYNDVPQLNYSPMEGHLFPAVFCCYKQDMHMLPLGRNGHVALQRGCAICMLPGYKVKRLTWSRRLPVVLGKFQLLPLPEHDMFVTCPYCPRHWALPSPLSS